MQKVFLGIGTNIGDRDENIDIAYRYIENKIGNIIKKSNRYKTAPWGVLNQPDFINTCVLVETIIDHDELLKQIADIEKEMGRIRYKKWGERLIDIDILFYGNEIIKTEKLTIPHSYIQERIFVVKPLEDIDPNYLHPVLNKTIAQIAKNCSDKTAYSISKYES